MKFEDGIDTKMTNEDKAQEKDKYSAPVVVCYGDIRDITLGGSIDLGYVMDALKGPICLGL